MNRMGKLEDEVKERIMSTGRCIKLEDILPE